MNLDEHPERLATEGSSLRSLPLTAIECGVGEGQCGVVEVRGTRPGGDDGAGPGTHRVGARCVPRTRRCSRPATARSEAPTHRDGECSTVSAPRTTCGTVWRATGIHRHPRADATLPRDRAPARSFHEASTVFADPLAMLMHDPGHSVGEERYLVPGASSTGAVTRGESRRAATPDTAHQRAASHPQRRGNTMSKTPDTPAEDRDTMRPEGVVSGVNRTCGRG